MTGHRLFIDGEWVDAPAREPVTSPFTGATIATIPAGDARLFDRAADAAGAAFREMRDLPRHRRRALLDAISRRIESRREDLARVIARDGGKPIRFARAECDRAVVTFRLAAEEATRTGGEVLPLDIQPGTEGFTAQVYRFPRGPVAALAPFNFPLNLVAHKVAPALAVGASVCLKPPPQAPLAALELARIFEEAARETGAPLAAFQVLHCPVTVAERFATDDRYRVLSFTGSPRVGWMLKAKAARKHVILELGGNAALVVADDADLERAARRAAVGAFAAAGQVCIKVQRVYAQAAVYDDFRERFLRATAELRCGDPEDDDVTCGPLIDAAAADRVLAWIDEARAAGATVLCGGTRDGNVVRPTVIEGAAPELRVVAEEVFGPVATLHRVATFEEGLAEADRSEYGLQAGVFTSSLDRAYRALRRLEVGGLVVNEVPTFRVDSYPYGGVKASGYGREGVRAAMQEMTETRTLVLHLGDAAP